MAYCERHTVSVTTASNGTATYYTPHVTGRIINVIYTKTDFADTADFTITVEGTAQSIWTDTDITASETVAPRQPTHSTAGVASKYDTTDNEPIEDHIWLANDRVKIVIAQGGDTKTGTFDIVVA